MDKNELQLEKEICSYLVEHSTLSLATCHENRPWSTDLFYASDESCQLYFVSNANTRHCQYIEANNKVSATISGEEVRKWQHIKGLQLDGRARIVPKGDRDRVIYIYLAKFPDLKKLHAASTLFSAFLKSQFYQISPEWIRLIDNSMGFGNKRELTFHCR